VKLVFLNRRDSEERSEFERRSNAHLSDDKTVAKMGTVEKDVFSSE